MTTDGNNQRRTNIGHGLEDNWLEDNWEGTIGWRTTERGQLIENNWLEDNWQGTIGWKTTVELSYQFLIFTTKNWGLYPQETLGWRTTGSGQLVG